MIHSVKSLNVKGLWSLCFLFLSALLFGCSEQQTETDSYSEPVYSKQYRSGALTAIVSLSATNIPSSGKITAMLEIHAPDGTEPSVPNIGSLIDPFTAADGYTEPPSRLPNGRVLHRRTWLLIPARPGDTVFQPIAIRAGVDQIETAPIAVSVTSLIPDGAEEPVLRDIAGPIELLPEQQQKRRSVYTVAGAVLILTLLPVIFLRLRKPKMVSIVLPHEEALRALEHLPENPVERIHELSSILRHYIEEQFNLPLIGKTVDEASSFVTAAETTKLDASSAMDFLSRCDSIRFSNKVPNGFAVEAEQFVRQYVETTMEVPE